MNESLLSQAANITLVGMSVVFVFLILLVFIMKIMGYAVAQMEKYFPQAQPQSAAPDNTVIAVAIAAAKRFAAR